MGILKSFLISASKRELNFHAIFTLFSHWRFVMFSRWILRSEDRLKNRRRRLHWEMEPLAAQGNASKPRFGVPFITWRIVYQTDRPQMASSLLGCFPLEFFSVKFTEGSRVVLYMSPSCLQTVQSLHRRTEAQLASCFTSAVHPQGSPKWQLEAGLLEYDRLSSFRPENFRLTLHSNGLGV